MPLVRISMMQGRATAARRAISDAVHQAMVDTISIPADDRFQILADVPKGDLIYDAGYKGIARTDALVVIQITLNAGRTIEVKRKLYARIAELLKEKAGVRPEDVLISLIETTKENWSFGNGLATYAP